MAAAPSYQQPASLATSAVYEPPLSNNQGSMTRVITPLASFTLDSSDSGSVIIASNGNAADTVVLLPALQPGLKFKFVAGPVKNVKAFTVTAPAAICNGLMQLDMATGGKPATAVAGATSIAFAKNVAIAGDFVEYACDGIQYSVLAMASAAAALTVA
jgi:hypothetical protein